MIKANKQDYDSKIKNSRKQKKRSEKTSFCFGFTALP